MKKTLTTKALSLVFLLHCCWPAKAHYLSLSLSQIQRRTDEGDLLLLLLLPRPKTPSPSFFHNFRKTAPEREILGSYDRGTLWIYKQKIISDIRETAEMQ
jgi:hypothetical protein